MGDLDSWNFFGVQTKIKWINRLVSICIWNGMLIATLCTSRKIIWVLLTNNESFVEIGAKIFTHRVCELMEAYKCGTRDFVYFEQYNQRL